VGILFDKIKLQFKLLFKQAKKSNEKISLNKDSKILIICFETVEYTFATTPLIKIIKDKSGCTINVLTIAENYLVFKNNNKVEDVILLSDEKHFVQRLNEFNYDVLLNTNFQNILEATSIVSQLKAKYKISFRQENNKLYSHTIPKEKNLHIVDQLLLFAEVFSFSYSKNEVAIEYTPELASRQFIVNFIIQNKLDTTKPLVGINISSENDNFWGVERFRKIIKYLSNHEVNVIILRHPIDNDKAEKITRSNSVIFNNTSYNQFAAIITELDFLFTPDSSAVQIASSKKIPMFILYNKKENAKQWCPYNSNYDCVIAEDENFDKLSYGKTLNSFIPFFESFINTVSN